MCSLPSYITSHLKAMIINQFHAENLFFTDKLSNPNQLIYDHCLKMGGNISVLYYNILPPFLRQ